MSRFSDIILGIAESKGYPPYCGVGLLREGFEEELMTLLTAIYVSLLREGSASSSKLVNRGNKELKRLSCSINYDSKGGSSSQGKVKGRGFFGSL